MQITSENAINYLSGSKEGNSICNSRNINLTVLYVNANLIALAFYLTLMHFELLSMFENDEIKRRWMISISRD